MRINQEVAADWKEVADLLAALDSRLGKLYSREDKLFCLARGISEDMDADLYSMQQACLALHNHYVEKAS